MKELLIFLVLIGALWLVGSLYQAVIFAIEEAEKRHAINEDNLAMLYRLAKIVAEECEDTTTRLNAEAVLEDVRARAQSDRKAVQLN
jgi:hypothetical protein